jgi:AcrR family transcriptional regulator
MARKYELNLRAERQHETRKRIVNAAVELHQTKGPSRTTMSDVARLAGVQRHTLYRHFPDERALFFACSGSFIDANPPPDAEPWRATVDPAQRLRQGLSELYAFFGQAEDMLAAVLRDAESHPLTREMFELRAGERLDAVRFVLAETLSGERARAMLDVALHFHTWRRLTSSGLRPDEAVETMVTAILCQ